MSRSPPKRFWGRMLSRDGVQKAGSRRSRPETVSITRGRFGASSPQHGITNSSLPLRRSGMCSLDGAGSRRQLPERLHEPDANLVAKASAGAVGAHSALTRPIFHGEPDPPSAPPVACSAPLDKWTSRTRGSGSLLPGKERSTPGPHGCAQPNILPRRAAAESAPGSCQGPVPQPDTAAQLVPYAFVVGPRQPA
jgi:hypothetical protein